MMKKNLRIIALLLLAGGGCLFPDRAAEFSLKQMAAETPAVLPAYPLAWEDCRRMAPEAEEYSLHRLFVEAAAAEEAEVLTPPEPEKKRPAILRHAKARAALASAMGFPPETALSLKPLSDAWRDDLPPEKDLKALLLLSCAEKGIREEKALREKKLALHCAFLDLLAACEEADWATAAGKLRQAEIRRRGHLARLNVLELIGEKDFSAVPDKLDRLEKEEVREEKEL